MSDSNSQNWKVWLLLPLLVAAAIWASNTWQVSAVGTDDAGGVVTGPPSENLTAVVDEGNQVVNQNPASEEPFVSVGGERAETLKDDESLNQSAAFAFGVANGSGISFSGIVGEISSFTKTKWDGDQIDTSDIVVRCLTDDGQWTASEVDVVVTVTATSSGDYTYTVAGTINQHGTCAVFFSSGAADEDAGQPNRDVNPAGVSG